MAQAGVKVTFKDNGLKDLFKNIKELGKLRATVGYQGQEATKTLKPGGPTTSAVARYNEFGTKDIPARAFMRRGTKDSGPAIAETAAEEFAKVVTKGADPVAAMAEVGDVLAVGILAELETTTSWATPNAPSTIKKKGPGLPPLDAGHQRLHKGLTWAVQEGRAVVKRGKPNG